MKCKHSDGSDRDWPSASRRHSDNSDIQTVRTRSARHADSLYVQLFKCPFQEMLPRLRRSVLSRSLLTTESTEKALRAQPVSPSNRPPHNSKTRQLANSTTRQPTTPDNQLNQPNNSPTRGTRINQRNQSNQNNNR